jgi:peptidoglycan/xylan/chitin deacetylase (PgdA/CDA1 family)
MTSAAKRAGAWLLRRSGALSLHRRLFEKGRAAVLMYHRINDHDDPFFPATPSRIFFEQIEYAARNYRIDPLEEVFNWLEAGAPGRARVAITIDDGYPDTHDVVLPFLQRRGIPATLFLATSPPETGIPLWLDRLRHCIKHARKKVLSAPELGLAGVPLDGLNSRLTVLRRLGRQLKHVPASMVDEIVERIERDLDAEVPLPVVLTWDQLRSMIRGPFSVGGHTHTHHLLSTLDEPQLGHEIQLSLDNIERELGSRPTTFAYPNGEAADYDERAKVHLRSQGVRCSVTSKSGFARPGHDPLELPRVNTGGTSLSLFAGRIAGLGLEVQ